MDVANLLDSLVFGLYVEVVVARLPYVFFCAGSGEALFYDLNDFGEWMGLGFCDEEVYVVWHDYVGKEVEGAFGSDLFEDFQKGVAGLRGAKDWAMADATEGDEVEITCVVVSLQAQRHSKSLVGLLMVKKQKTVGRCRGRYPTLCRRLRMGAPEHPGFSQVEDLGLVL